MKSIFSLAVLAAALLVNRSHVAILPVTNTPDAGGALTLADRVAYQRAIEEVYWRHRIWPEASVGPKPSLDKVMSQEQIEKKVGNYLRDSQALEDYWQRPITSEQLQAEMERIAAQTKQPGVLREIFAALGNNPLVIAECLARAALAERMVTELYAHDQRFHGELKRRAEAELRMHRTGGDIKQTSGLYSETDWIKSDGTEDKAADGPASLEDDGRANCQRPGAERGVKLNAREWQESVARLAAEFDSTELGRTRPLATAEPFHGGGKRGDQSDTDAWAQIKTGVLSPLREDDDHYYALAVIEKGKDRLKLTTVAWLKEPLRAWVTRTETQVPTTMAAAVSANYTLPVIGGPAGGCIDNTWVATAGLPDARRFHTVVWTGSEMIVWGGASFANYLATGGRYNPSTDSWTATNNTNAPNARTYHSAVWSGSEMIVWGGYDGTNYLSTGGRYDPSTDSWTTTSTANAPTGRYNHTAIWTGGEMIVWGGFGSGHSYFNSGRRYNPSTDSWTATGTTNAPNGRANHQAVWTGSAMIVWGGYDGVNYLSTGGRYDPGSDSWTATSSANAPIGRLGHTVVWSGNEMIVWGGQNYPTYLNSGGRYNPGTDSWTATGVINAPSVRGAHTAVWTGSEMIVWGGYDGNWPSTGGRYNPGTDSWTATSAINVPDVRSFHTAVWTGSEMIVWGGATTSYYFNTGARYDPSMDRWTATGLNNAPSSRNLHTAVWTGSEMIVWGGYDSPPVNYWNSGGRYSPATDSWTATSTINAPEARYFHTAVWTGTEMIVWGGYNGTSRLSTGGRYNPSTDSWTTTNTTNAPDRRYLHTAAWTGSEMIVWGGYNGSSYFNTGGRYNPGTDVWIATGTTNAPTARAFHTAVWTGSEMIVWGGTNGPTPLNSGATYDPIADSWTAISSTNAPGGRYNHTAVWTGSQMIVWGGYIGSSNQTNTGGRYNASTNKWTGTSLINAPSPRFYQTAIWTGAEMIVWGGGDSVGNRFNTGGRYNPGAFLWTPTSIAPVGRTNHTAVWTGGEMVFWGGDDRANYLNTGGRYCAQLPPMAQAAASRKSHGVAGTFDINLPLTGSSGIECRSGGPTNDYQIVFTFPSVVTFTGATVTVGTGTVSSSSGSGTATITVNLTGVTNAQRITIALLRVNDGTTTGDVGVEMGVLIGDTNGDGVVNSADISQTRSKSGQTVDATNFREDVNVDGGLNSTDVSLVKSQSGTGLP